MKSIARKLNLGKDKDDTTKSTTSSSTTTTTPAAAAPTTETKKDDKMSGSLPKTYKAAVITGQQKPLEIQELPMPEVKEGEILLKVLACGVCHSDHHVLNGDMGPPQIKCLGHEYVGDVVAVGPGEKKWKIGDRAGGAWHGGHDGTCRACARGQFQMCTNKTINGVFREGGYGQYATLRSEAGVSPHSTPRTHSGDIVD